MASLTRWVLAHKRIVAAFWVIVTLVGAASAGSATKALKQKFSVPGREGWTTNQQIIHEFHGTGGEHAPLLPVVTLPAGRSVDSPAVQRELAAVEARLERILPGTRLAGYASTHSRAFLSADGRTTFIVAYPPPDPNQPFGDNPNAQHMIDWARIRFDGTPAATIPPSETPFSWRTRVFDGGERPGGGSDDLDFHLHRFHDQDRIVFLDVIAHIGDDPYDLADHWSDDRCGHIYLVRELRPRRLYTMWRGRRGAGDVPNPAFNYGPGCSCRG